MATIATPLSPAQLKALRLALQRTQAEMGALLGVDTAMWQKWEYGYRNPSRATVSFCRYLAREKGIEL